MLTRSCSRGREDRPFAGGLEVGDDLVGRGLQLVARRLVGEALDHQESIALVLLDLTVVKHSIPSPERRRPTGYTPTLLSWN